MTKQYLNALNEVLPCVQWINHNHPDCIKFYPDDAALRGIAVYLEYNKPETYVTMTLMYGILFTLAVLEYYIACENYEKCQVILDGIHRVNHIYKCDLPTSIDSTWVKENKGLSPSEILHKHFNK